ncbi:MAG: GH92 family glycosyl hydrolase [Candidatus Pseudobacter hemicellulosilyticus]|uniref:GH92 family glycosyl hydrolase n=1 Tax=Candidatus Pseudobacter hemicellulosilyticus TaxID=3121375 RepID=A0AAJ5WVG6_9BACT|nr:MAG: GH92 family glycosyl hydrolase [Pseudobacter sp.]
MFRKKIVAGILLSCLSVPLVQAQDMKNLTKYVNPFIGTAPLTDSAILGYRLPDGWRSWAGLVFPGSSLPNAMVQLSPITEYGSGAGYEYEDTQIFGFTHTNKGHWNLCNIPLLPFTGKADSEHKPVSRFSHSREAASPAYYEVFLEDYGVKVQLTSTLRCGYHRYDFGKSTDQKILFDLARANNRVVDWRIEQVGNNAVKGYQDIHGETIYFYAELNTTIKELVKEKEAKRDGMAYLVLDGKQGKPVEVRIGMSFVSMDNARQNLEKEIGVRSFDAVRKEGVAVWQQKLSSIQVKGGTAKQLEMFYSCLYRSLLWPALRSDVNGQFTDAKKQVVKADWLYYTEPSLWDTYRNKDVLLSILSPDVALDVIKSMKDVGEKTGFIPTFFHGDHGASSIAGAYLRGITDFDVQAVYQLLLRNANVDGGARPHIKEYIEKGYISELDVKNPHVETKAKAGVSKTLEYAYDDYSLAQLAKKLGDSARYRELMKRSQNYRNVFDPGSRFMRGRLANGEWITPFDPQYPYYEYMYREANAWQVSFYAPHDMPGLVELYGGPKPFEAKLDSLFTLPWDPQHIARNVESMVGQYCHGNQPDHEAPYGYYFVGKPEKSQQQLDHIMNNLYGIGKEGLALCGMDDAGEMSAWYVWNALGLYTFSATDPEYIVTVPLFDKVKWRQPNGKTLLIEKTGKTRALDRITIDSKPVNGYFVPHNCFTNGSLIRIQTR